MKEFDHTKEVMEAVLNAEPKALLSGALIVENDAINRCPVGQYESGQVGGNLRGSITHDVREHEARIGTNADYAPHVEFGTAPHIITVKTAKVLTDGKTFFGKKVNHPGTAPQPYLRPALDENKSAIQQVMGQVIKDAIKGVTG